MQGLKLHITSSHFGLLVRFLNEHGNVLNSGGEIKLILKESCLNWPFEQLHFGYMAVFRAIKYLLFLNCCVLHLSRIFQHVKCSGSDFSLLTGSDIISQE